MSKDAKYLLNSDSEAERCMGIEILSKSGQLTVIELLTTRLEKEQSPYVRRRIIEALRGIRCAWTAEAAAKLLSSDNATVRNAALEALQGLDKTAIPVLAELLQHPSRDLRKLATDALSKIPGEDSFSLLLSRLQDPDPNVVCAAVEALGVHKDPRAVPFLLELLKKTDSVWVGFGIIESLAYLGNPGAMEVIQDYINIYKGQKKEKIILRGSWTFAVGKLGDKRWLPEAWDLYDQGEISQSEMVLLLYAMHERGIDIGPSTPRLEALMEDQMEQEGTRELLAAIHLSITYCPNLLYSFLPHLSDKFAQSEDVTEELVSALVRAGPSVNRLVALLSGGRESLAKVVISVVEKSGISLPLDTIRLLAGSRDSEIALRASALAWRCGAEAKGFLKELLLSDSEELTAVAVSGLGIIGGGESSLLILKALEHPSGRVRRSAAETIINLSPPHVIQDIEQIYINCPEFALPEVLEVIASLQDVPFLEAAFQRAVSSGLNQVRVGAAKASHLIKSEDVFLKIMETLVNDPDHEVRRFAIHSMAGRRGEGIYRMLSYLYKYETCHMNRYFILNCEEVYSHPTIFEWLMESIEQADPLLKLAAVRGFGKLGVAGAGYLKMILNSPLGNDESLVELILQETEKNGGLGDGSNSRFI